ncbi:MAG: ADP-forming succinate--CoA ligase subunit beta [Deltaproteobacteria bacterium]|nr:ADP-forming succinate--CoA ligase subunit beta [Deltaproteobacteria bacterium]MBW2165363.1 ADP-forming succinate--CoA ligase subunit beta [Deltaproteobacteria bacterium]
MKIHEYQAKELFKKYKISIPDGGIALTPDEAKKNADKIGSFPVVIKGQIHAGGRGKGGGIKLAETMEEVESIAKRILGMLLITHQTGPKGKIVKKVLVEKSLKIEKELYLSIIPDRATAKIAIIASKAGGMDIEEVAANQPEKIIKIHIDPLLGIQPFHCRQAAFGLKLPPSLIRQFTLTLINLYRLFVDYDCTLVEINPLAITANENIVALDAKIIFDDNALFRHKDILEYRDLDEEDPFEVEASKFNLNYIKLSGNVGNMVNGAGLAMATMDLIKLYGAEPANFLDVGGTANAETVENGFRIILSDKNVKAILINIFGGILRCDLLAKGVVQAADKAEIKIPVVIRMEGTNVEEGRRILSESGLNFTIAADLKEAVQAVTQLVKHLRRGHKCLK